MPSQDGPGLAMPQRTRNQFTTLNDGSRIHIQAMVDSTVGTMNGSSMIARIEFLNLKSWFITSARASPPTIFRAVAANV